MRTKKRHLVGQRKKKVEKEDEYGIEDDFNYPADDYEDGEITDGKTSNRSNGEMQQSAGDDDVMQQKGVYGYEEELNEENEEYITEELEQGKLSNRSNGHAEQSHVEEEEEEV